MDYDPNAGWAPGAELEDLGELSGLLQGYGPIVQPAGLGLAESQALADEQILNESHRKKAEEYLDDNIPTNQDQLNNLLDNLFKSPALAQEDNAVVLEKVTELRGGG